MIACYCFSFVQFISATFFWVFFLPLYLFFWLIDYCSFFYYLIFIVFVLLLLLLLLLHHFSRVRFCATPWTAAHLAPFIFKSSLYIGWHRSRAWHTPAGINESSGEMWAEGKGGSNKLRCLQLTILSKVSSNHRGAVRWRLQRIEKPWTTWQTPQSSVWFPFTFYKH